MIRFLVFLPISILLVLVSIIHILALQNEWYWSYAWMDMLVHFLVGGLLGLTFISIARDLSSLKRMIIPTMIFVLLTAVMWEIFEYFVGLTFFSRNYGSDTTLDILMALCGAVISIIYISFILRSRLAQNFDSRKIM